MYGISVSNFSLFEFQKEPGTPMVTKVGDVYELVGVNTFGKYIWPQVYSDAIFKSISRCI